jgi:membrane protease YdiL (CAAX protease family)
MHCRIAQEHRVEIDNRATFLRMAGLVEGGVVLIALLLAAWLDLWPLKVVHPDIADALWGVVAIVPMLLLFFLARGLRRLVVELLGQPLSLCTWYDLLLVAALAGFGEELLFRGVLQPWIGRGHPLAGLIGANLIFGLMHALTPGYAALAAAFGFYLSWLVTGFGEPNLLRPIVAHAAYDYVAFLLIVREYRQGAARDSAAPPGDRPVETATTESDETRGDS